MALKRISSAGELRLLLGLESTISDAERAFLAITHPHAEKLVKDFIGYDPVQHSATEYYPMSRSGAFSSRGAWDVNTSHTRAVYERQGGHAQEQLQLIRLPVRSISSVKIDENGHFGKGPNAFPAGSEWTEGEDFYPTYEQDNVCLSGLLEAQGTWPLTPGSIEINYRAGYSQHELAGFAEESKTESGVITTARVDASGLKRAVFLTVQKAFQTWAANKKSSRRGFAPGVVTRERAQDYSYTVAGAEGLGAMLSALPPEAAEAAEPYRNYGLFGV